MKNTWYFSFFGGKLQLSAFFLCGAAGIWLMEPRLILPAFFSGVVHETGHIFVLNLCHSSVKSIIFTTFGAKLQPSRELSCMEEFFVALAGPTLSLLFGLFCAKTHHFLLSGMSFSLGLCNLLPVFPLDGGRVLRCLCVRFLPLPWGERVWVWTGRGVAAVGVILSLALLRFGSVTLTLFALWLLAQSCLPPQPIRHRFPPLSRFSKKKP